jgi:hypothetical protein
LSHLGYTAAINGEILALESFLFYLFSRDNTLHPMLFKEGGLPDYTLLTYKLKNGEVL